MAAKGTSSGAKTSKPSAPTSAKAGDAGAATSEKSSSSGSKYLAIIAVIVAAVAAALAGPYREILDEFLSAQGIAESTAAPLTPGQSQNSSRRRAAEVEYMPASMAAQYEITDAEELPYTTYLLNAPNKGAEQPMGVTFRSFYPFDMTMWWDNGTPEGVYSGSIRAFGISATNSYTTHVFHFRKRDTGENIVSVEMKKGQNMVFLGPAEDDDATRESSRYKEAVEELKFRTDYYEKHNTPWLSHYPPVKPALSFWPADFVGQEHKLRSFVGYFNEDGTQSPEPVELKIKVVSVQPRVVVIENLLSPAEIEHILNLGKGVVRRSSVGSSSEGFQSDTRTSDNGWISRKRSNLLNTVYDRFADVLNMTDAQASEGPNGNIEQLQFVRYRVSQKYDPHHDFGYSGKPEQRFSTLFIYLQPSAAGGATSFPKAFNGRGIKVKPPAGTAVLFYSMLEDGNGDDLSLHSGMPVSKFSLRCAKPLPLCFFFLWELPLPLKMLVWFLIMVEPLKTNSL